MGISESQTEYTPPNGEPITADSFFSASNIQNIRNEFKKIDPLAKLGQPVNCTMLLSTVIEKIISSQRNNGDELPQKNVEDLFFQPIIADSDAHIESAKKYEKYFIHMIKLILKAIDDEETSFNTEFTEVAKNFASLNKSKTTSTRFLESVLSASFETIFDDLDVLSEEDVIQFLDEMLSLLNSNDENSLVGISSPVVQSMHRFALKLGTFPRFQTIQIQCRVVFFLFKLGFAQSNISGCISALTYLLTLPPDGQLVIDLPDMETEFFGKRESEEQDPGDGFNFTPVNVQQSKSLVFLNIIESLSAKLMHKLDIQIEGIINKSITKSSEFFSFVVDSNEEVIELAQNLVRSTLEHHKCNDELRIQLVALGLKIISLNLFRYCLNFSRPERNVEEADRNLFDNIIQLIEDCTFSDISQKSPAILESVISIIVFTFRYLYFPDYSRFVDFETKILENDFLRDTFMKKISVFLFIPCLVYMFTPRFCELLRENNSSDYDIIDYYISAIDSLTNELRFIENNSAKENEEFIAPLVSEAMAYAAKLIQNKSMELGMRLLKHIIFRVVVIDSFPLVAAGFVQHASEVMIPLVEICKGIKTAVKADADFLKIVPQELTIKKRTMVIETPHNYPDDFMKEWVLDYKGASSIHLAFDPKCHTEIGNDVLRIYQDLQGDTVIHTFSGPSSSWPESFDIPCSQARAVFTSDASVNYWGVKCEVSAIIPKQEHVPSFDTDLFLLNFLFHTIGRLILVKLQSLEISNKESKFISIINSPFIQKSSPLVLPKDQKEFIDKILDPESNPKFIEFMNKKVKCLHKTKRNAETISTENYAVAAMLYQLGIIEDAMELEKQLETSPPETVPFKFTLVWRSLNSIKLDIFQSNQKMLKLNGKTTTLREDYPSFIQEIVLKCKALLDQEPGFYARYGNAPQEKEVYKKFIEEVKQFITCDVKLSKVLNIIEVRRRRLNIRRETIDFLSSIIETNSIFGSSQISLLLPIHQSLSIVANISDVSGVSKAEIQGLSDSYTRLFKQIVTRIINSNGSYLTLIWLQILAVPTEDLIAPNQLENITISLADYASKLDTSKHMESIIAHRNSWRLITVWTMKYPSQAVIDKLHCFAANNKLESCQHKSIYILTLLSQMKVIKPDKPSTIISFMKNATPRVIVACLSWLEQILVLYGSDDFEVELNGEKYDFEHFIEFILSCIGSTMCGSSCNLIDKESLFQSHHIIVQEMITLLRICTRPFSKARDQINSILHRVFQSFANVEDFSQISEERMKLITAIFAVLGFEITMYSRTSSGVFIGSKTEEHIIKISSYDPITSRMRIIPVADTDNLAVKQTDSSEVIPAARIPANPFDFDLDDVEIKIIASFHNFSHSFLSKATNLSTTNELAIANFFCFMPIVLQTPNNMQKFLKLFPVQQLLSFASTSTNALEMQTIGELMHKICLTTTHCFSLVKSGMEKPEAQLLPYSLVFDQMSTLTLLPLRFGVVTNNVVKSTLKDECVFVGDCAMPSTVLFYYEITIKTISNQNFQIGLLESSSTVSQLKTFTFDFKKEVPIARFLGEQTPTEQIKIKAGDTIGCGYTRNSILFFHNGQPMKSQIPVTSISSFVPVIITNKCPMNFSFNFGEKPFVADVISSTLFDIKSDCLRKIDVPIPTHSVEKPHSCSEADLDSFINEGMALWDIPKQYNNEKPGAFNTTNAVADVGSEQYSEFKIEEKSSQQMHCVIGQPVIIARRSLNQSQSLSRSFSFVPPEVETRINRFGIVKEIAHDRVASELDILTVEVIEPESNCRTTVKVDARFVDPIDCGIIDIANYFAFFKLKSQTGNAQHRYCKLELLKKQQFKLIKNMCLYMSRYVALSIFDYARMKGEIDNYATDECVKIFKLAMLEISKFKAFVKVQPAWQNIDQADYIFCDINETRVDDIIYKCPGDLKRYNWFMRAFLMSKNISNSKFIIKLIESCLKDLNSQTYNFASDIFEIIKPDMIIESWHPMPLTTIKTTVHIPENYIGFIPVIHPLQSIGENGINVGSCVLHDVHSDTQLFTKDCKVTFKGRDSTDLYGIKLGFFLVPKRIPDAFNETPLGGLHCLIYALSMIFSYKEIPEALSQCIKQRVFTACTSTLNSGNLFADVFCSRIIAPILTSLNWVSSDITEEIKNSFDGFSSRYDYTITEWGPLSVHAQQSLVMKVFTKLLVLDTMASALGDNPDPQSIANLYDQYIQAQTITKETNLFQQMIHAFSILCALGFGLTIPIRFPAFLIAQSWAESFELISTTKVTESCKLFENPQMKSAEIRLAEESKLPADHFVAVEMQSGEVLFLNPGDSVISTPTFTTRVVSKSGHEEYDGEDDLCFIITVTCIPLTHEAKRRVFVENYSLFKQHVNFMAKNWTVVYDETLRRILKTTPEFFEMVPLVIPDIVLASNAAIAGIPAQLLRCRIYLFKCLDTYMSDIVKVVEFGSNETLLEGIFNSCRAAVATQFKLKKLESVVLDGISDPPPLLIYKFNRFKAALHRARPTNPNGESILSQFINQTPPEKINALKRESVPWRVDLIGEGATDLGGPGRDLFTEACMEIMDPSLGLFIQTPNKRDRNGPGQEFLIPNPTPLTEETRKLYFYSGLLMTICYISKLPEPFKYARFVWNYLTQRPVKLEDIYEIDYEFKQYITSIEECTNSADFQQKFMLNFTTLNTLGKHVELIPGGSTIPVTYERRLEYVNKCKKFRVKEFNEQLEALRSGFLVFFHPSASSILAPWELELIICGDNTCPIEEMKRNCNYPANDPSSAMLWEALETFSPEERMLFIKFGCGRMGLPPPGSKWTTPLQIQFKTSDLPDPQKPLPTAMTCNSMMIIPKYSSVEMMAKKIKTAITFGADIQQDHAANFGDIVQFT